MVSLASDIAWCMGFSLPKANWDGEIVWLIIDVNLLFSRLVKVLKSAFNRLIFLLSFNSLELDFPGLWAKTMLHVLRDAGGFSRLKLVIEH